MEDLAHIVTRIHEKKRDYTRYNFSKRQGYALKTFFDLAQEFDLLEDLYRICVVVPKTYFNVDASLYLRNAERPVMVLVCSSTQGYLGTPDSRPPAPVKPRDEVFTLGSSLFTPIRGKLSHTGVESESVQNILLGMLEISPSRQLSESDRFYIQKFANRIGYALFNKLLGEKNREHLRFINSLVADIEHNVIVPNMLYRVFLRQLHAKIRKNQEIEAMLGKLFAEPASEGGRLSVEYDRVLAEIQDLNRALMEEYNNIERHHRSISLSLESLFRRSHFQEGRFIPRTRRCNFRKEVVDPQLERFEQRFHRKGIEIDSQMGGVPDETMELVVDVGLISQVYANLLSNALKYTGSVHDETGSPRKFIASGREVLKDYFGQGKDGIKFNVFSTGSHIPSEERELIYEEEYRGSNARGEPGTGHGLSFVRSVVRIHGGDVGYEPTHLGNNFYFILPK